MKLKLFLFLFMAAGLSIATIAQVPQQFSFQGVARNANGQAVASKSVSVRFTIHQGAETGGQVFQEVHNPTTNAAGVFNVAIGSKSSSQFQDINWSNNVAYYLEVEIDPAGGSAYTTISTSQLLSVPYAIAASRLAATGSTVLSATGTTIGSSGNKALAANATAIGYNTTASGENATAVGNNAKASNANGIAMGYFADASGPNTFAVGAYTKAAGPIAIALGARSTATGTGAMIFGTDALAGGDYSTAMGNNVNTGTFKGSFIIGDYRALYTTTNSADNQMVMRFGGGYRFYTGTTGFGSGAGVSLDPNGNSWSSISDSTKKENYLPANGPAFLSKIKGMKLGSWNYKGQDRQQYRHYGPMAQEFHSLFGNDGVGTIGNDTTIASADIDGVMMITLQALVKQTEALQNQVKQLDEANKTLQQKVTQLAAIKKEY